MKQKLLTLLIASIVILSVACFAAARTRVPQMNTAANTASMT